MKYIFPLLFLGFVFTNCNDDLEETVIDPVDLLTSDLAIINKYLEDSSFTAQMTESNLSYIVEDIGRGQEITADSTVNILLKGSYLEPNFSTSAIDDFSIVPLTETGDCSPVTLFLPDLIAGFSEGVQLFNTWGKGTLLIPSTLGYGQSGTASIPAFSVLVFEIEIVEQAEFERTKIRNFITENNLSAIDSTESGIYYTITEGGNGERPDTSSTVSIIYNGFFADSTVFDISASPANFSLSEVIPGWHEAIPILDKGGSGTFLIPSNLAYGPSGNSSVPSNTMLIYDITLVDFN